MQPNNDISVLDWLKEKLKNPRELFKRTSPGIESPHKHIESLEVLETMAPASESPSTGDPDAGFSDAPTLERPPDLELDEQQHPGAHATRIKIVTDVPHGTTVHITLSADAQGNLSVLKRFAGKPARKASVAWDPAHSPDLKHFLGQFKTQVAFHPFKTFNLANWFDDLTHRLPILHNGLVFIILAMLAVYAADGAFRQAKSYTEPGLMPLLWAALLFSWATWVIHRAGAGLLADGPGAGGGGVTSNQRRKNAGVGLLIGAFILVFWVARDAADGDLAPGTMWMLIRWVLAMLMVSMAAWLLQENLPGEQNPGKTSKWPVVGMILILLLALGLRIWNVSSIPFTLGGDEGEQGTEILRILNGTLTNPFTTGWYSVPTFSFFFNTPTVALFGNTIFGLRLTWVLIGTLSVLTTYLLVKELKGTRLAILTSALVATYHYHIHYSRLGSMQVSDTLIVALTLLFIMRGYRRGNWLDWALAGVVAGIGQYFYAGGRLAVILVFFLALYLWVRDGFKITRANRAGLGVFLLALLVAGGPMFAYATRYPDTYNARTNQVGILQNGWLVNEAVKLGKTQGEILLDQFWRSALAFNAYPDRAVWYGLTEPLLDKLAGMLFLLGVASATLWSIRDRRLAPMVAWWWAAILTGGMLTDTTPSSQRLITTAVPTMFFVAWAIEHVIVLIQQRFSMRLALSFGVTITLLLSVISLNIYFNEYSPKRIYGGEHAMIGTMLSDHLLNDLGPQPQLFFFGAPRMFAAIGTMRYLTPDIPRIDVFEPLTAPFNPGPLPGGSTLLFVFLPERASELQWVQQTFPIGQLQEIYSPLDPNRVLYVMYTVQN